MPVKEPKSLQLYNSFALLSATAERTSSTMQRDTTRQPTAHGGGGGGGRSGKLSLIFEGDVPFWLNNLDR